MMSIRITFVLVISLGVAMSGTISSMTTTTDPSAFSTTTMTTTTTDPSTPNYTQDVTTSQLDMCVDKIDTCNLLDPTFYCVGLYFSWAIENCAKTCNLCGVTTTTMDPSATTATTATTATVCQYKGAQYTQGEAWHDGCHYNCTCEDVSVGYYRCVSRCHKYINLPPGCNLQAIDGECCAKPDCGVDGPDYWKPEGLIIWEPTFCSYKGQYYAQDEQWTDGCSKTCTCTDMYTGKYACRAVCLNWKNMPSICHMDDAPSGLCCQQPRCPDGIVITIPTAYKDQYPGYVYV